MMLMIEPGSVRGYERLPRCSPPMTEVDRDAECSEEPDRDADEIGTPAAVFEHRACHGERKEREDRRAEWSQGARRRHRSGLGV